MPRLLIADGNDRNGRATRRDILGRTTAQSFADVVTDLAPDAECVLIEPADADAVLPAGLGLHEADGLIVTGSTLRLTEGGPAVERQLDLMRAAFAAGLPVFGSCWGIQVAAAVAGGHVGPNPRGPEYGFARRLAPTPEGAAHPLLAGRGPAWDAPAIHADSVLEPPPGSRVLASNAVLDVQAIEIRHGRGLFWGTQYHPEVDPDELAAMLRLSAQSVVEAGLATETAAVESYADEVRALADPEAQQRLAWRHGLGADLLEPARRRREIGNFLAHLSTARGSLRGERDRVAR
ncbi:GMP synthase (glutamine-hydrolyzing) [Methylorubrum rhodinum]|uniref:GMP synthase (Glutamine-hydrolyzing) n=1 Tax=Methylorubrum rhodinum TaxID=29428 RepID=A0A840ZJU2_9HYPH|nr:type 1 glutamine amidotransferase [Methylorubrum rhodinum]MBB5757388.1 GMP synthase (glutamine-hydrolyzing) [Methylorubrum rhodinum]